MYKLYESMKMKTGTKKHRLYIYKFELNHRVYI